MESREKCARSASSRRVGFVLQVTSGDDHAHPAPAEHFFYPVLAREDAALSNVGRCFIVHLVFSPPTCSQWATRVGVKSTDSPNDSRVSPRGADTRVGATWSSNAQRSRTC